MFLKKEKIKTTETESPKDLVLEQHITKNLITGEPHTKLDGGKIMVGLLTGGLCEDNLAKYTWTRASTAFGLVAFSGWSGYRFEDGDWGIDGYFASEHPLADDRSVNVSKSAIRWGERNGHTDYAHTWINGWFKQDEATLMHDMVYALEQGIAYEGSIGYDGPAGSGTFYEGWGEHLV